MIAKNVSDDSKSHTDDVTAIAISHDRRLAASGQVGSAPAVFIWDSENGAMKKRFQHNVYVFDTDSGAGSSQPGDSNKVFDICFSAAPGDNNFVAVGAKTIKFWDPVSLTGKKGIFGTNGEMTSFACCAYDDKGVAYAGGSNSRIYVWNG